MTDTPDAMTYPMGAHLRCKCGAEEVPYSDKPRRFGEWLQVHGLFTCFALSQHNGE